MAPDGVGVLSFDEIITRDREERQRKDYQSLADNIFRRNKKDSQLNGNRKSVGGASLASRVGITKSSQRSQSNPSRIRKDVDLSVPEHTSQTETRAPRLTRTSKQNPMAEKAKHDLLSEALVAKGATNHIRPRPSGAEITIRGAAGPYVVIASNFAPGTTAADIESAMVPSGTEISSCRIITASPTVMAEMVFSEKQSAEGVIETFNNKKADGRILHVYMKAGGPSPIVSPPASKRVQSVPKPSAIDLTQSDPPQSQEQVVEQPDRSRRRAEPQVQDGRYGFANKDDQMDVDMEETTAKPTNEPERRDERRADYRDERYRQDNRYNAPPRDYRRSNGYDRGWANSRPDYGRRPYGETQYPRYPTRGYR